GDGGPCPATGELNAASRMASRVVRHMLILLNNQRFVLSRSSTADAAHAYATTRNLSALLPNRYGVQPRIVAPWIVASRLASVASSVRGAPNFIRFVSQKSP